ncbi:MAG TPA: hypothetical protein VF600_16905 [Abditibacteriaceae bacterium]|jgi:hypothetical protein
MKRAVSRRVLFVGVAFLLATGVARSESTRTTTFKTTTAKTSTTKPKAAKPATASPKTVLDYFMLLPQDFFEFPKSHLKSYLHDESGEILMVDKKNDYLRMAGDAAQATIYMALFRHKGRVLVGTYSDGEGGGILHLMRYENGKWRDVTKAMLPVPYNDNYIYIIPRYGTTIKVTTGNSEEDWVEYGRGKKVYELVWTQGKFKVRRS